MVCPMASSLTRVAFLCLACVARVAFCASARAAERDEKAGLYAIWTGKNADLYLRQPYITGGQIVLQWRSVEPAKGRYTFAGIDARLAEFAKRGRYATIQINGNRKPDWLFDEVPRTKERLSTQVQDPLGTLMYWHPAHRDAYLAMLRALGEHMKRCRNADCVIGIRMNLNALGTEHHRVPKRYASPGAWTVPKECDRAGIVPWTNAVDAAYVKAVVDTYIRTFSGSIRVFVRNNIDPAIVKQYEKDFQRGALSWFHTSSEAEPRASYAERKYGRFYDYCRSGKTTAYAEPWASAWGHHGGKTDDRWCSPPQWNYWRLLFDLHCGVSYIALYANDMRVGIDGTYPVRGVDFSARRDAYRREFDAAFRFAATYVGYHAAPETSPGAWVAFRENNVVRAANGMPEKRRKLVRFTSDYDFLMRRVPGDASHGLDVVTIGPDEQRFGAWARRLPAGQSMRLALDGAFARSLARDDVGLRVVCLAEEAGATVELSMAGARFTRGLTEVGRWEEWRERVPARTIARTSERNPIVVRAGAKPVCFHMVEVRRRAESLGPDR